MNSEKLAQLFNNINLSSVRTTSSASSSIPENNGGRENGNGAPISTSRPTILELLQQHQQQQNNNLALLKQNQEEEQANNYIEASLRPFYRKNVSRHIQEKTRQLPIFSRKQELLQAIKDNQFIVVVGETGSGKSTQIPQYIAEAGLHGNGVIGVTQPRRVAAKALANRVAEECGVKVGTLVGYAVRFDKNVAANTVIKYMTDGTLVKECTSGAGLLDEYSIIMIDEAHERRIDTDVCFGLLKRAASRRPELKVIISSATLQKEKVAEYFNNAPIFNVSGKGYDVEILYEPMYSEMNYLQGAVDTVLKINRAQPRGHSNGDILVFLPGQEEIEIMWDMLEAKIGTMAGSSLYDDLIVTPCYGGLLLEDQQKIFDKTPDNCRKVVLATNIAETSLTIDGIVYVIDCGFFKQNQYNPKSGIYSLVKQRITKFQAIQRAGRAGRTRPGKCYRLYTENEFIFKMKETQAPEITRCNLESVILTIVSMGIDDPRDFDFMDKPPPEAMAKAIEHLRELSAIEVEAHGIKLTYTGQRMAEFPLSPPLAKVVIESEKLGCSAEVVKIVALLSFQNIFSRNRRTQKLSDLAKMEFEHTDGDLLTLLNVYNKWIMQQYSERWCKSKFIHYRHMVEAEEIRVQISEILRNRGIVENHNRGPVACPKYALHENIRRAFTAGYFRQLAKKTVKGHAYQVLGSATDVGDVFLHPSSSLFKQKHPLVIYQEIMTTKKTFMKGVISVESHWIKEYAPQFAKKIQMLI